MDADARPRVKGGEAHVLELDGIRGVAIVAVIAAHFLGMMLEHPQNLVERVVALVTGYGMWGVDLFFVLSGFLITGILWESKESPRYFKAFYMRRTLRIFPLYYGILLLLLVLIPASWLAVYTPEALQMREVQGWLWTYLTNVYVAKLGTFGIPYVSHFWTLAIEEHFYLFWPLVIKVSSRRGAMITAVVLSVLALGLRLALGQLTENELWAHVVTPCRLDSLCIGSWFALAIRGPTGADAIGRHLKRWLLVTAGLLGALIVAPDAILPKPIGLPLKQAALALTCGAVIFAAAWSDGPALLKRAMRLGFLRLLGKYSYGLYVFHAIIAWGFWYHGAVAYFEQKLGSHTLAVFTQASLGMALSFLLAFLSFNYFEVRFLALKRWFKA